MTEIAYPSYVPSGVEWLGDVPAHWPVNRLATLFSEISEVGDESLPILSVSIHDGVSDKELEADELDRKVTRSDDRSKYKRVAPGDLVYNMMRAWQGGFGAVQTSGMVSPAYVVARPKQSISARFIEQLLRTPAAVEEMRRRSRGVTDFRLRLYWEEFKGIRVAVPPASEQAAIVDFLDRETGKIDALVEEQKRLIELLREKRQAVISHTVTKGLNPDAPMKDTGIEWLGEVPERWRICRLKHIAARDGIQMGPFGGMLKDLETEPTGYRLYGQENTITGNFALGSRWLDYPRFCELNRYKLEPGDLVMTRKGSIGNCRLFPGNADPGVADSDTIRLRLDHEEIKAEYALRLLHDALYVQTQLSLVKRGAILAGLNTEVVANLVLVLPPIEEQQEILSRLQYVSGVFQRSLDDVVASIALLQERRAALISAAVTGKIDVRGQSISTVVTPDFRESRKLVAAKIVEDLSGQKTFGRVKLQKLLYLAEAHGGIHELSGHYVREAAGPLDRDMVREVEASLQACGHVVIEQPEGRGTAVNYQLRGTRGAFETELATLLGDRISALSELIETVGALDTRGAEAVATLYAVWNEALASGTVPSDDEIIREVLNEWHPKKAETFTAVDLKHWLAWMCRNGLKPKGNAPLTSTGRLFV